MKHLYTLFCCSVFGAFLCSSCQDASGNFDSEYTLASLQTVSRITGTYTMISATFSEAVDLSGDGPVSKNLLAQLEAHGWLGISAIAFEGEDSRVVFEQNEVLTPADPSEHTQINFYVPYPMATRKVLSTQPGAFCDVFVDAYQFYYQVDRDGSVSLYGVTDRQMQSDGETLQNVSIRFEGSFVLFETETSFYDWSTDDWRAGRMELVFRHN